ncbi:hypothetical protein ACFU99_40310, partial [Streptomyces sp. NPDC057654]|uniref:hypothetical protein n=1 Tax=Streptomyces sp. NPDC057654 TaxID=3346196 RepID=UPI00369FEE91
MGQTKRARAAVAVVCAGVLGWGAAGGTAEAHAHSGHATPSGHEKPPRHATPPHHPKSSHRPVHVEVNGAFEARPGEIVDIVVTGLENGTAGAGGTGGAGGAGVRAVVVTSPVFPRPVRLSLAVEGGQARYAAHEAVSLTAKAGRHPVRVDVDGRVAGHGRVRTVAAKRPEFRVVADRTGARPGERVGLSFDDLYPGERGTSFTVRSRAFRAPVPLRHDTGGLDWNNPRMFTAAPQLPSDVKDGTYEAELTGPDGRRIAGKRFTVRAARPGDSDYVGRGRGPAFFDRTSRPEAATTGRFRVEAGGIVKVLWSDMDPDAGEEERLTATSAAFDAPVPLRRDDSKAADGDDPRFYGPARIRPDVSPGSYP